MHSILQNCHPSAKQVPGNPKLSYISALGRTRCLSIELMQM